MTVVCATWAGPARRQYFSRQLAAPSPSRKLCLAAIGYFEAPRPSRCCTCGSSRREQYLLAPAAWCCCRGGTGALSRLRGRGELLLSLWYAPRNPSPVLPVADAGLGKGAWLAGGAAPWNERARKCGLLAAPAFAGALVVPFWSRRCRPSQVRWCSCHLIIIAAPRSTPQQSAVSALAGRDACTRFTSFTGRSWHCSTTRHRRPRIGRPRAWSFSVPWCGLRLATAARSWMRPMRRMPLVRLAVLLPALAASRCATLRSRSARARNRRSAGDSRAARDTSASGRPRYNAYITGGLPEREAPALFSGPTPWRCRAGPVATSTGGRAQRHERVRSFLGLAR